ncbi:N-acetylmuramoyl-L-alanine amidase family protein [Chryseobacterium indoltheticum]|uniref:N-acetylmuramoyl-L-alanine amidase n=1 Tax=Chryseobacterium indoltheticum TaxID=254 RepID=A0A381JQ12_9FLAO|nr:N-acetylmuramoyl-L-alanine amidase [Chryseobacterium indoltheticum]AZA75419.1 N-acetylmuramoyl-L-alanine amidase [Chryseobacterium indoltheticum]SIQ68134.1 N-acetylmuramoyl-L-alanine amidase [Chryseobacterium indoltheticum]SUY53526.1 N-acetylmuramoyl-L-alanine amidase LytC precursor [Chryseobacterium indoltheticum]
MKALKLLAVSFASAAMLSFSTETKKIIVIDAGHGGNDFGATMNGVSEKDMVLNIARQIKKASDKDGTYEVILTRSEDTSTTLTERTEQINKLNPEMVISLHINRTPEANTNKSGHEIFMQKTSESKSLAEKLSKKLGECSIKEENLHILRNSKSPAVLVELGYINNTKEREYMNNSDGQREIAQKFADFINEQ